jgi:hypothetical protein
MVKFGELKYLNLRTIWPNETTEFTPWLAENIQKLGEAVGMELELIKREAGVGDFSLDLLAKDLGTGHNVIIENQFGATNHDHLGKLLTYAAGFDALTIVWIAETIRDEHRQALEWLNQRTDSETQFFGVVVEVFQIDDSKPAFKFKPIVFPNEWQKNKRQSSTGTSSPRAEAYRKYFQELIDELREKYKFTGARIGQPQSWYSFASGFAGAVYGMSFAQGERLRVELYIDQGDLEKNKKLFDWLAVDRETIEAEYGERMEWERLDDRKASRIAVYRLGSIESDAESLVEIRSWAIEKLLKFEKIFGPRLKRYKKGALEAAVFRPTTASS